MTQFTHVSRHFEAYSRKQKKLLKKNCIENMVSEIYQKNQFCPQNPPNILNVKCIYQRMILGDRKCLRSLTQFGVEILNKVGQKAFDKCSVLKRSYQAPEEFSYFLHLIAVVNIHVRKPV